MNKRHLLLKICKIVCIMDIKKLSIILEDIKRIDRSLYMNIVLLARHQSMEEDMQLFYNTCKLLMIRFEGVRKKVYDDKTGKFYDLCSLNSGKPTIGIGCNLSVYGPIIHKIINKDSCILKEILSGKYILSENEICALFSQCYQDSIYRLKKVFCNESILNLPKLVSLILFSLSFNGGYKMIRPGTTVWHIMKAYSIYPNRNKLVKDFMDLLFNLSKSAQNKGLARRRLEECAIFSLLSTDMN